MRVKILLHSIILLTIYLGFSVAIGYLGSNKKFGFVGNFFASLFLTPIVGLILLVAQHSKDSK